ncbi:MAG TPA: SRPBCC family protein [Pyrinomonadaceae bacterium]|jgi:uncharacterized protein YndB with AHSA1/START domain
MERAERAIEIDAPVERVFELLSDFESFPRWMRGIREVRRVGRRATRWRVETAAGEDAVWVAETTVFEPDHRLAWRSLEGDVEADGELILQETRRGTTLLRAVLGYGTPGGRSGEAAARFFGRNPERQLDEDLARFRRQAERHAEGVRRFEEERELEEEEERRQHRVRRREEDDAERVRESERVRDGERERRFEEALGEARRSQLESMRRYREEREREIERGDGRDERSFEERPARPRFEGRPRAEERDAREDERGEFRPGRALTPRERERVVADRREHFERTPERDYMERLRRRGVDRLLDDDPPSRNWRRRD